MKIIFCNITYLRYYDGRTAGELTPVTGGSWVKENSDAHERWNFLNMDGKCYGFVQGLSDTMHIERFEGVSSSSQTAEDVTVIWCALKDDKTVIVGWYEHAVANRWLTPSFVTPISGIDRAYWFETEAENAYLLPEDKRSYRIGRASQDGPGKGFGQYNYWFADSEYAKENAQKFNNFNGRWVTLRQLCENLPGIISERNEALKIHGIITFEDELNYLWLVKIRDYIPVGSKMPFDNAREMIDKIIINTRKNQLINDLETNIYNKAKTDGSLEEWNTQSQKTN